MTEEQLAEIQKRFAGKVREHKIAQPGEMMPLEVKSKYGNRKTEKDGIQFDSKKEADRYGELRLMELANEIVDLKRQVSYDLRVNGMLICRYRADFVYTDRHGRVVEDTKGFKTQVYAIKKKLMKAVHNVEIKET